MKISILTIASIMIISMLGTSNIINAHAQIPSHFRQTIEIINELDTELKYKTMHKQRDVTIVTFPPKEVKAGDTGSFTIEYSREIGIGLPLFHVIYYVGQSGKSEVKFGIDQNGCFTETPDDIKVSYEGCYKHTLKFTFQPK